MTRLLSIGAAEDVSDEIQIHERMSAFGDRRAVGKHLAAFVKDFSIGCIG